MKTITILSGKGGVGKSSISASLAVMLSENNKVVAADCDVDAADLALLFGIKNLSNKERISTNTKAFVNEKIKGCRKIVDKCVYSAISWDEEKDMPKINKFLCEGCGVCKLLCPEGIDMVRIENAVIGESMTSYGFPIITGQLEMGESGSGKVVDFVKHKAKEKADSIGANLLIVDSSPGIGCPVIASVKGSDYIIVVVEPTSVSLSAVKRVLHVVEHFGIKYGFVINKSDLNKEFINEIEDFAKEKGAAIIQRFPFSKDFVDATVNMKPVIEVNPEYRKKFEMLIENIAKDYAKSGSKLW